MSLRRLISLASVAASPGSPTLFREKHNERRRHRSYEVIAVAAVCISPIICFAEDVGLDADALQDRFHNVAQSVSPSVVAVSVACREMDADDLLRADNLSAEKLDKSLARSTRLVGSGFCIDRDGFILTNQHVIDAPGPIWVTTDDQRVFPAMIVGSDPRADLAVLKIAANLPAVTFASNSLSRGDWSIALGNPLGLAEAGEMSLSVGVVSALDRNLTRLSEAEHRSYAGLIETTAQIAPGNSGGPLTNLAGQVIGIDTAVILPQANSRAVGFAMPITSALLSRIDDLKHGRAVQYGYLGVNVSTLTLAERRLLKLTPKVGIVVDDVEFDSPADRVVQIGDVILSFDSIDVSDREHFIAAVGFQKPGSTILLNVLRAGERRTLQLHPRARQLPANAVCRDTQQLICHGLTLENDPSGNVVVAAVNRNDAQRSAVSVGDFIASINGRSVSNLFEVQAAITQAHDDRCALRIIPGKATLASIHD